MSQIDSIFREKELRNTPVRRRLLEIFNNSQHALSHSEIESITQSAFDRVTIYRTLNTFVKKGIIHEIIDDENRTIYSLCSLECSSDAHHDDHVHFKCESCDHTFCINNVHLPNLELPEAYQMKSVNILVSGLCANCSVPSRA